MTIKIKVSNEDESRDIEVEYVGTAEAVTQAGGKPGATIIGPQGAAEFYVHSSQGVVVREVAS
jgi:hypothetical protein